MRHFIKENGVTSLYYFDIVVYISEKGSDEDGDGSEGKPFKSVIQAMRSAGKEPFPVMYVDGKDDQVFAGY